jgi:hypothetical protein
MRHVFNIEPSHVGDSTTSQTIISNNNIFVNEKIPNKFEISMQA